ncbi:hypothetical protein NI389_15835 [Pseudoalteromonas xiamenensis]|uniref:hypothetical protein n=1 Tax=Pseudoalteromonas xiamenensis TaxID=882626 RepID=UPI0027E50F56|nr:hypothetical protein [Pseudoalteromonas xiamenensis]WMN59629.1 hypothetical protein NI389_15835 [Pseudoalteromonas xiamenensis]
MRKCLLASLMLTLTACGGGGGSSGTGTTVETKNQAPTIVIEGETKVLALSQFVLKTQLHDNENDTLKIEWSSSLAGVVFSNVSNSQAEVSIPAVETLTTVTLTAKVTDSANNSTIKTHVLTVTPNVPTGVALFDLAAEYSVQQNDVIKIPVKFDSPYPITAVDWSFVGFTPRELQKNSDYSDYSGTTSAQFRAPTLSQNADFNVVVTLSTTQAQYEAKTKLAVKAETTHFITVDLPEPVEIIESHEGELIANVMTDEEIEFIEWDWLPKPEPEIISIGTKQFSYKAPEVDRDTTFDVSLKLTTKSGLQASDTTKVTVKNATAASPVILKADRKAVATGHTAVISVTEIDLDEVTEFQWEIGNLGQQFVVSSKGQLEVTFPNVNAEALPYLFTYTAKLKSGQTQTAKTTITYYGNAAVASQIGLTSSSTMHIYPREQIDHVYTLSDPNNLVDSIGLESSSSLNTFNVLDVRRQGRYVTVTARIDTPLRESSVPIVALLKTGTYVSRHNLNAVLSTSKLKAYTGLEEQYLQGSSFYLTGLVLNKDEAQPFNGTWQVTNSTKHVIQNPNNAVTKVTVSDSFSLEPSFKLVAKDANQNEIESNVSIKTSSYYTVKGDMYQCTWSARSIQCKDDRYQALTFAKVFTAPRQVITKGNYACVLDSDDIASCAGQNELINSAVLSLSNVVKLDAVDNSTVCAQFVDLSWACVGDNAARYQTHLKGLNAVFGIQADGTTTCYVENGYLKCSKGAEKPYFTSSPALVKWFEVNAAEHTLCYKELGQVIEQCHSLI